MDLSGLGHRGSPLQGRALGRPEWSVCASSSTLQAKEKASWLLTIDRTGIASHVFNAVILEAHRTTVCPIRTILRTRQIVDRLGLSGRQRRGPIGLWDSGADQFGEL